MLKVVCRNRLYSSQTRFVCENIAECSTAEKGACRLRSTAGLRLKAGRRYTSRDCDGVGTFIAVEALLGDSITF
jgi:hypothetical protein